MDYENEPITCAECPFRDRDEICDECYIQTRISRRHVINDWDDPEPQDYDYDY